MMPSCYKIFDYWKDKRILENGEISDSGFDGIAVVENEALACCWACGMPVKKGDIFSWDKYDMELSKLWSDKRVNSKLQKCHIRPKMFNGEDTPDNLFLMCCDCHAESPDTTNRTAFFRWVYRKRKRSWYGIDLVKIEETFKSEIESRGYDFESFLHKLYVEKNCDVAELVRRGLGECGSHASSVAESTMVVCIVDSLIGGLSENEDRKPKTVTFNGVEKTYAQWSHDPRVGVSAGTIRNRIEKQGWTVEDALFTPSLKKLAGSREYRREVFASYRNKCGA